MKFHQFFSNFDMSSIKKTWREIEMFNGFVSDASSEWNVKRVLIRRTYWKDIFCTYIYRFDAENSILSVIKIGSEFHKRSDTKYRHQYCIAKFWIFIDGKVRTGRFELNRQSEIPSKAETEALMHVSIDIFEKIKKIEQ